MKHEAPQEEEPKDVDLQKLQRLAELELRAHLAEQARQLAHRMRTPLNVIELVCETLRIELQEEEDKAERLDAVLDAVANLSSILSETVAASRFASGPPRPVDAVGIAAHLVELYGGSTEDCRQMQRRPLVVLQARAFEAAIMHSLRLIGVDRGGNAQDLLSLACSVDDTGLSLRIAMQSKHGAASPRLVSDQSQLASAAERVARDSGGTFLLTERTATFHLPIATR